MKYEYTRPCDNCPFRKSTSFGFPKARAREIVDAGSFSCHKTTTGRGRNNHHKEAQACAGRLIMLERDNKPDQMMRIAERIGLYDRRKLDMNNTDVFDSIEEFMEARVE